MMIGICKDCLVMTHKGKCPICGSTNSVLSREQLTENILAFETDPTPDNAVLAAECQNALLVMNDLQGELA